MNNARPLTSYSPSTTNNLHFYIYAEALSQSRYSSTLADIETRLTDLGLQGHVGRLGPLKNAKDMLREALQAGAKTIVAVGTDDTFAEVINAAAGIDVLLGFIPVTDATKIGHYLGIANAQQGCKIIAARKIETLDLGRVNTQYFLTDIIIESESPITLNCDNSYSIEVKDTPLKVRVANLSKDANCQDGVLNCLIDNSYQGWFRQKIRHTNVPARRVRIESSRDTYAIIETSQKVKLPIECESIPSALRVIVGKDRIF